MSKPVGPYSPAVKAGDLVFCSGQVGQVNGVVADGFENQVRLAIANLETVLKDSGLVLGDVVKATVYLTDMSNYSTMNVVYLDSFGGHLPARAAVGVSALPLGAQFEIEAIAHVA